MKHLTLTLLATTTGTTLASNLILPRASTSEADYILSVCQPNTTDPTPPCSEIAYIQEGCTSNGTSSSAYLASAECICNGGFFDNWLGCLDCEYFHGARSEAVVSAYQDILSTASSELCGGSPTTDFAGYFAQASSTAVLQVSGLPTTTSDQAPSDAAVSLYFTASGPQGEGVITGSATLATATASADASSSASVSGAAGLTSGLTSSAASSSGAESATSSSSKKTSSKTSASSASTAAESSSTTSATGAAGVVGVAKGLVGVVVGAGAVLVL